MPTLAAHDADRAADRIRTNDIYQRKYQVVFKNDFLTVITSTASL